MNDSFCDPVTGVCRVSTLEELSRIGKPEGSKKTELIYVGDPMCSWCWGLSPSLKKIRDMYSEKNIPFRIVVGGLRPGGGDRWDENRKSAIRQSWSEVAKKSGQPFNFKLFDLDEFDYDTEPSCRAIVSARSLAGEKLLEFFEASHRKFYVDSEDPKEVEFYRSICDELDISFEEFKTFFESDEVQEETFEEFDLNRSWGVQGFPALILSHNNKRHYVTHGFSSLEKMVQNIEKILSAESQG